MTLSLAAPLMTESKSRKDSNKVLWLLLGDGIAGALPEENAVPVELRQFLV